MSEKERALIVSETFVSIQGEGPSQGAPAAFLRLGQCNLSCSFCDTAYTWDEARFNLKEELRSAPHDELLAWFLERSPGRIVVTGGEPLIQHKALLQFLGALDEARLRRNEPREIIEIETNGTIEPSAELSERVDQFNVSPKLGNSGQPASLALRRRALEHFAAHPRAVFKFVVGDNADASEALELARDLGVSAERVLFMPLAADVLELRACSALVAALALRHRVRFATRLHLELFGGGRGV